MSNKKFFSAPVRAQSFLSITNLIFETIYGKVIRYEYDEAGNLKTLTYPDNTKVHYEYDENRNLTKVTDWAGRVTEYSYDKNNRVTGIIKPNGTVVTTTYERNKVKTTEEKTASGQLISGFEYEYDNLSRVRTVFQKNHL